MKGFLNDLRDEYDEMMQFAEDARAGLYREQPRITPETGMVLTKLFERMELVKEMMREFRQEFQQHLFSHKAPLKLSQCQPEKK